jgi:WD40 repeat protein/energy-coupling factor transporter ATP-binding protein EcfA2
LPGQRAAFAEVLSLLFVCAGDPPLKKVAASATAAQRHLYPGASEVTAQRLSDWRRGKRVPQRFESVDPVLRVLIGEACGKKKTPPAMAGMYDLGRWRQWWEDARTASDDGGGRSRRTGSAPSPACPYQGLAAFKATDQARFFGRARSVEKLVAFIAKSQAADPGIVLLTGPSGAGKSSLLSAGLIPAVSSGALHVGTPVDWVYQSGSGSDSGWVSARMTPSNDPMAELQRCLDQLDTKGRADGARVLIIVDQGEELFGPDVSPQSRAEFVGVLHAMSQPSMSTSGVVVMGLRSDALGRCVELAELADAVQFRCMVLGPMNHAELRDVVVEPAKTAGLRLEPGLVDLILNDVGVEENSPKTARLPLLSHVLAGTWSRRRVGQLTVAGYRSAGGVRGSVAATGEHAWNQLDEEQRTIARRMLLRLVTIGETQHDSCRREPKQELLARFADAENAADVLEILTVARLLTIHDSDVTFTHEIVLRAWPRLAAWIDGDRANAPIRQRAEDDAAAWIKNDRNRSFLQSGARLDDTLALLAEVQDVDQSLAQFAAASRRHMRLVTWTVRAAAALLTVLTVVCASVAVVAIQQRIAISRQYNTAVFNQVLAAADERRLNDPSLSAQLVMVAQHLRPNDKVRSRLLAIQNAPLATQLTGHSGEVSTVTFSPDGNLLASASWDNTVRLWDTSDPNDPKPVGQPLQGHTSFVTSVAFSPDGKTLASSSGDKTVRLWDLATPTDVKELTAPLTGGGAFYLVAFSADGRTLAAPSDDRTVRLWDVTNRRVPHAGPILSGHTGPVRAIAFSPNGHTLASASNDKSVRLWDVTNPTRAQQVGPPLTGFTNIAHAVAFDPVGHVLAATGEDGVIHLWNVTDPSRPIRLADPFAAHDEASWSLAFSPDGTTLASSGGGTAKLWNVLDPSHPVVLGQPLANPKSAPTWVAFRPDGRYLATGSASGTISLWTLPTGVITNYFGRINSPAFSADGTVMVTASDNVVQLWNNVNHLTLAAALHLPDNSAGGYEYEARVDPSGRILATALSSVPTMLWDISDITKPVELSTLPNTAKYTNIVAFSPNERTVVTAGDDYTLQLWDITEPRRPRRLSELLTGFTGFINAVMFSPDGRTVVAGSADHTVRFWDITDRDSPIPSGTAITGHTAAVVSLSFSPDGKTLATGSQDQTIGLWEISDPRHATPIGSPLHSHSSAAQIVFSPDGKTLASGGDDGSVLLWDIADQTHPVAIGDPLIPPGVASRTRVAFDPHGRLYAASRDGTIRIFNLDTDNTMHTCASTRNVLTEEQWSQVLSSLPYDPPC